MATDKSPTEEPRFFFLMPVWGDTFIDYLLSLALPTLLAPNNFPWLPNLAQSEFIFLTTTNDEKRIRSSKLFAILESLIPIKFILIDFHTGDREEKFLQLGDALKLGAEQAMGRGFCFFLHPDGLYSDGMMKHLYGLAKSGKKACVSHGPNADIDLVLAYMRDKGMYKYDEVNPVSSRPLSQLLMDNLHPDVFEHCMGHPHYPEDPYMGFWLAPKLDGALFRFVSLHPWMVDLSDITKVEDFNAIDHNFIRAHGFIWSDIHVETDSDNFLVVGLKPKDERNAIPSPKINQSPVAYLVQSLLKYSNCNYSRFFFFNGLKVHTGDLDREWNEFEVQNLRWLNRIMNFTTIHVISSQYSFSTHKLFFKTNAFVLPRIFQIQIWKYFLNRSIINTRKFFEVFFIEKRPGQAIKFVFVRIQDFFVRLFQTMNMPKLFWYRRLPLALRKPPPLKNESCVVCHNDARRCVGGDMDSHGEARH